MVFIRAENVGLRYPFGAEHAAVPHAARTRIGGQIGRGWVTALEGVGFALAAGDRLGLVGPNGAGKTTLLKVLYGIYPPSSGRIERQGRVDALFNINLGFRPEATGRRNIVLRGLINGWGRREIERRVDGIIAFSELEDFIDLPLKTYSAGMSARLAFAIATAFEPEILLMDEWLGAGDADFRDKAKARMDEITAKAGIIVLASHSESLIRRVCNRVLELEHGVVKRLCTTAEYYAPPLPAGKGATA